MSHAENKANRLQQIEALLLTHPEGLTQAEIARRLGVNRSTILRNLVDLPAPIYEESGRYFIDRESYLINVRFSLHEAMAVHLASRLLSTRMDRQNPHAAAALRKLGLSMATLAPRISHHLEQSADTMDDSTQRQDTVYLQVLEKLTLAWAQTHKVRLWHRSELSGNIHDYILSVYFIEPYAVGQTTHVIGWSEPQGAMRTFKIERITAVELLKDTYTIPKDFDPKELLADAWGIWYKTGDPIEVVLKFGQRVAQRVGESRWHRSEQVSSLEDGSLLWRAWIAEPQEMLPWIRGWGADVEVLQPEGLRRNLIEEASRLNQVYKLFPQEDRLLLRLMLCWGKTSTKNNLDYHPAISHMLDTANVAHSLLTVPASRRWRITLARVLGTDPDTLANWLPAFIALHDIGKISASFQKQNQAQLKRMKANNFEFGRMTEIHHSMISQVCVRDELQIITAIPSEFISIWSDVYGGHHGYFQLPGSISDTRSALKRHEPVEWKELRNKAVEVISSFYPFSSIPDNLSVPNLSAAIMALTGFTILCDWLASNETYFLPSMLLPATYQPISSQIAAAAVREIGFLDPVVSAAPQSFKELFANLQSPRPLQLAIDQIPQEILKKPCLAIIEAPTGEGKTEAALALAHRIAAASGSDEFFYALPTTATSNQMYGRIDIFLQNQLGLSTKIRLIHSQANLQEESLEISLMENGEFPDHTVEEWFRPKKKALLAPFGVGTVDQAELGALNVAFNALRLMGLAGKTLILDEVHAYDTYMTTVIERLLQWLSAMGTSVILLSATLPKSRRETLLKAYGTLDISQINQSNDYPSIWVTNNTGCYHNSPPASQPDRRLQVRNLWLKDDNPVSKAKWLVDQVAGGGCICWITNTVDRAQKLYKELHSLAGDHIDQLLIHSRFPVDDRQKLEKELTRRYGPGGDRPQRGIVVGTQVLEQSLDLDFDGMVSDIAPVDLLLQRSGRLHRHDRVRPMNFKAPVLWISCQGEPANLDLKTDRMIYPEYILLKTWDVLRDKEVINLPADYRVLIQGVYDQQHPPIQAQLANALENLQKKEDYARQEARLRLLPEPDPGDSFTGPAAQLRFEDDEDSANWIAAQTRLGEASANLIPLEKLGDKVRCVGLPYLLDPNKPLPYSLQFKLANRAIRVSHKKVIAALQKGENNIPAMIVKSPLLKRYLPLWLEAGTNCFNNDVTLKLDPELGLVIE